MKTLGLLGKNISYSFSPNYFKEKFEKEGIEDFEYKIFDIQEPNEINSLFSIQNLVGFNVTIPYKKEIIKHLDDLSEVAMAVNAVNTVVIQKGKRIGHNTDIIGFEESVKPMINSNHKKALVLGTGGASTAVTYVLNRLNLQVQMVSRQAYKGRITYQEITKEIMESHSVIVNCTPLGTHPTTEQYPNIPYKFLTPNHLLFDLIYNPTETEFLKRGKEKGAAIKNGLEMLHLQADAAWRIWQKSK